MPRIRRHLASRSIRRRSAVVLALTMAGGLAAAGIALGAPATSSVPVFTFSPTVLPPPGCGSAPPCPGFKNGRLHIRTHTNYTAPVGNNQPGGAVKQLQLFFDDDFFFKTDAVPKCPPASLTGNSTQTLAQAMAACSNARISVDPSTAKFTGNGPQTFAGCVLVFNGQGATTEVLVFIRIWLSDTANCAHPATNSGGNLKVLLKGDLKANPNGAPIVGNPADYYDSDLCTGGQVRLGCQINFPNIPRTESNPSGASPLPLTDLDITIQKFKYINARCVDTPATLNLQTKFTYVPVEPSDTVNRVSACT